MTARPRFALFCKSFRRDFKRAIQLVRSVEAHAGPEVGMLLSVPETDRGMFQPELRGTRVELVSDEEVMGTLAVQSWQGQQSVKLRVHRMGFADAFMVVDSDHYFIRPFGAADFIDPDGTVALPVTTFPHVFEDHEARILAFLDDPTQGGALDPSTVQRRPAPLRPPWHYRLVDAVHRPSHGVKLDRIPAFFGLTGPARFYMPGPIWTQRSLQAMEDELLTPRGLTFESLLAYSPWEAQWVGDWELYRGLEDRRVSTHPFLHLRTDEGIVRARERLSIETISSRYFGLALAGGQQDLETF